MSLVSEETNISPSLFKGKAVLVHFLHQQGACILTTPKTHKEGVVIKLLERDKDDIRYYELGSPRVKTRSLASKEQLMVPALSLSFNPITRKSESCKIPFTAGWIQNWPVFKDLLYENLEYLVYSRRLGRLLGTHVHEPQTTGALYAVFRTDLPPVGNV
jgi:hypothetical protein